MAALFAQIFMGWPAILGSLALAIVGIRRRGPGWLIGSSLLSCGPALYLLIFWPVPVAQALGYGLPFLHLGAAAALYLRRPWLAWVLLLPHIVIAAFLGAIVLSQ